MAPLLQILVCDLQAFWGGTDSDRASPSTCAREPATGEGRLTLGLLLDREAGDWGGKLRLEKGRGRGGCRALVLCAGTMTSCRRPSGPGRDRR